ncbi:MAG TPA: hypothetical protein VF179_13735 [Thermoanaerobaculia bacterium]|nr:hypothetical protein [Thermoanaerobaculia bacterium]
MRPSPPRTRNPLPRRSAGADADRLLEWGERVLAAETLEDVFRD